MSELILKLNNILQENIKNNNNLSNVKFGFKPSEELPGYIEILYDVTKNDDAKTREKVYNVLSTIFYTDYESKGLTKEEIMKISILYDYFNEIV